MSHPSQNPPETVSPHAICPKCCRALSRGHLLTCPTLQLPGNRPRPEVTR